MLIKKIRSRSKNKKGFSAIVKCDNCGREFETSYTEAIAHKNNYCNYDCMFKSKTWKEEVIKNKWNTGGKNNPMYRVHRYGEDAPNWKGGRIIDFNGYILIKKRSHPNCNHSGYVPEHRLVMEKHLGRYLIHDEVVHHLDDNRKNNKINNLMLFSNITEHIRYHREMLNNYDNS